MDAVADTVRERARDTRHALMAGNTGNVRLLTVLVLVVGLVAVANLIVCCVLLDQPVQPKITLAPTINSVPNQAQQLIEDQLKKLAEATQHLFDGGFGPNGTTIPTPGTPAERRRRSMIKMEQEPKYAVGKKVFTIQHGLDLGAYSYVQEDGQHAGFFHDLVYEVCELAGVECRLMYDRAQHCMVEETGEPPRGGRGLLSGWYDGCLGWVASPGRARVFHFTAAFSEPLATRLYVSSAEDTKEEDVSVAGKTVGVVSGAGDVTCLPSTATVKTYADAAAMVDALHAGEIDFAVGTSASLGRFAVRPVDPACPAERQAGSGLAVMTRVDSVLPAVWDAAWRGLRASGRLEAMCREAQRKHGSRGPIDCAGL